MNVLPKISIIIPVYNVEKYIAECLQSVMAQTYKGEIESILVDDCGKDKSIAIAEKLIAEYNGNISFLIMHHDHNRGLSAARNTGTKAATGDYIYYLDSDDMLLSDSLSLLANQLKLHPNAQCVQGFMVSSICGDNLSAFLKETYINNNKWIKTNFYGVNETIQVSACNKLLSRKFIIKNNLFFKEGILHEDRHWMFYVVKYLESISFVLEPTYVYNSHSNSIMTTSSHTRTAKHYKIILFDWLEHCDEDALLMQLQTILSQYAKHTVYMAIPHDENLGFLQKIRKQLWQRRQYKSVCNLFIWEKLLPFHNFRKLLRHAYENIDVEK